MDITTNLGKRLFWGKSVDVVQTVLFGFVITSIAVCILVLILFDSFAGTGIMYWLTNGKLYESIAVSLATTGLLMAIMFMAYLLSTGESKIAKNASYALGAVALAVIGIDVFFDALLADILRYGRPLHWAEIDALQICFRFLIGGISFVGDALSISMISGMPVLKKLLVDAMPVTSQPNRSYAPPAPKPLYGMNPNSITSKIPRVNASTLQDILEKEVSISDSSHFRPAPKPQPVLNRQFSKEPTYHPLSQDEMFKS